MAAIARSATRSMIRAVKRTSTSAAFARGMASKAGGDHFEVLCVGGGAAGLSVASAFQRSKKVGILEPSNVHYYQPGWTLVGGGIKTLEETRRPMADVMPPDATWIQDGAATFDPENNTVMTSSGKTITYDYMVVAAGVEIKMDKIKGLPEALEDKDSGVTTNYSPKSVEQTWKNIQALKNGTAMFTIPSSPIKCAGAPQKIMYLAEEHFRSSGVRDDVTVRWMCGTPTQFGAPKYSKVLDGICDERGIDRHFNWDLDAVDKDKKIATFRKVEGGKLTDETREEAYDMIHVAPRMGSYDFIANSPLAGAGGWVDVHQGTCQSTKFGNVFALGDCSSIPTSKTAAAAAAQSGVVKHNLRALMAGFPANEEYNGYTSCPLVLGRNSLLLAEFNGFTKEAMETFPVDQASPTAAFMYLKRDVMPMLYWEGMLKDRWDGPGPWAAALNFFDGKKISQLSSGQEVPH